MYRFNIPNSKYIDKFSLNATAKASPRDHIRNLINDE